MRRLIPPAFLLPLVAAQLAAAAPPTLWYGQPAGQWTEALPLGNGRLGAMVFGGTASERIQLNEESLWAGCPVEVFPPDYPRHLAEVRRLVLAGDNAAAHEYGLKHLTLSKTKFKIWFTSSDTKRRKSSIFSGAPFFWPVEGKPTSSKLFNLRDQRCLAQALFRLSRLP